MSDVTQYPLSALRFGHEAVPPFNVRRTDRAVELEPLASSIEAHGLIHPLVVRVIRGVPYVVDGNRRLAALQLRQRDSAAPEPLVSCLETHAEASEISLAANVMRAPLHEADQLEAFSDLTAGGMSEDEIASRFGIERSRVRRILAVGRLSPMILDAWRRGVFRDPVSCVRAFTLAPSLNEQERVFLALQESGSLWPHVIRKEFGAERAGQLLGFVGRDAYVAAGGTVIEDLFGDNHVISDPALVQQLADAKLRGECERLLAQGWGFAITDAEAGPGSYSWFGVPALPAKPTKKEAKRLKELRKIVDAGDEVDADDMSDEDIAAHNAASDEIDEIEAALAERGFGAEQRAASGCIVSIQRGELSVRTGLVRPGTKKPAAKAAAADAEGESPAEKPAAKISNALHERLSVQLTEGVQQAMRAERHVALAALLAGFLCRSYTAPVHVSTNGHGAKCAGEEGFAEVFNLLRSKSLDALLVIVAQVASSAIDLRRQSSDRPPLAEPAVAALVGAIDLEVALPAVREQFDAADYFGSAPKALVLRAVEEAINADEARKISGKPKPEIVAFALANVPGTGWLPPEMRVNALQHEEPGA